MSNETKNDNASNANDKPTSRCSDDSKRSIARFRMFPRGRTIRDWDIRVDNALRFMDALYSIFFFHMSGHLSDAFKVCNHLFGFWILLADVTSQVFSILPCTLYWTLSVLLYHHIAIAVPFSTFFTSSLASMQCYDLSLERYRPLV